MNARVAATAAVLLCACHAGAPPYRPPDLDVVVPPGWRTTAVSDAPVIDAWWYTFADERLPRLVEEAFARNHDLRAAVARVDAAIAQADAAGAPLYPTLDAVGDASRQRQNFIGFPVSPQVGAVLARTYNRFSVGLRARWELDLWGRLRAAASAAAAEIEVSAAEAIAARQSLAAQTVRAYLSAVETRRQIALSQDTVRLFTETAELVRDRFSRGIRPAVELRLARNSLAVSEATLEAQRRRLALVTRQLELLLGRYPAGEVEAAAELPAVPESVPAGLPAELLRRRPDVVAAERRLAATAARVDSARAALFPRIALTAGAGTASQELEDLLDDDLFVWDIAANLVQPIFDGGRLRAEVELQRARATEAAALYAQAALTAYTEVEQALAAEQLLRREQQRLADAEREALAALELANDRYRRGLDSILTVLESQRRAVGASSERIQVRRLILDARVDLHLALGGSFDPADGAVPAAMPEEPR